MPRFVSFDEYSERLLPPERVLQARDRPVQWIRDKAQANPEKANRIFGWLPEYDREICRLYAEGLTQEQIAGLLPLKQSEVSGRLNSCLKLLVFLDERPTLDPVQARADLIVLLPEHLVTVTLLLYIELSPTRVADMLRVSEGTAWNRRKETVARLEKLAALSPHGPYDKDILSGLRLVDPAGVVLADNEVRRRRGLALGYLIDFKRAPKVSARLLRPSRKNEAVRVNALIEGEPINGSSLSNMKSAE